MPFLQLGQTVRIDEQHAPRVILIGIQRFHGKAPVQSVFCKVGQAYDEDRAIFVIHAAVGPGKPFRIAQRAPGCVPEQDVFIVRDL
jgi:hypothetical protein